jgi:hypothetical protein
MTTDEEFIIHAALVEHFRRRFRSRPRFFRRPFDNRLCTPQSARQCEWVEQNLCMDKVPELSRVRRRPLPPARRARLELEVQLIGRVWFGKISGSSQVIFSGSTRSGGFPATGPFRRGLR